MTTTAEHLRDALDGRWRDVKNRVRAMLTEEMFRPHHTPNTVIARAKVAEQMKIMAGAGMAADSFRKEHGGTGDVGAAISMIELLAMSDLSLMVKSGVQWGLFGGALENLGTDRHRMYVESTINCDLLGCFAMTETGHGSDVQSLETTAGYDVETQEFVIDSATPSARKDYIGGAAETATVAAVFAQLHTGGESHGVHCFLVPIRDGDGNDLPGVTTSDNLYKGGLPGVDNGRIVFDRVRIPRENLLNRYADVDPDGTYRSPIDSDSRRFFTQIGTLVRGRVTVGGSAGAAARVALDIATRYALQRRQFSAPDDDNREVLIMDYLVHQRRLLPLIARSYALQFAQNQLVARCHELQSGPDPDPEAQRELEARAAGLKAVNTWHASRAIQEAREACGGAGYMAENRLCALRADTDVFTTFEGDNHVLLQLVAKQLLTDYADDIASMSPVEWVRFAAGAVGERVLKRTAAENILQTLVDSRQDSEEEGSLFNRGTQVHLFEDREEYLLASVARRLRAKSKEMSEFDAFNAVQDHVLHAARAHIDRVVLEAFVAGIDSCARDTEARELLSLVCDLYALSVIEDDKAWYIEHHYLSTDRAKAVTRGINDRCRRLRPHALTLVEGFGIPEELRYAEMLHPENLP